MRRIATLLTLLLSVSTVLLTAGPAQAWEVRITILGAGQITETTPANLVGSGCTTSASNPTGTLGATCLAGTLNGNYASGWTVRLVATAKPGYRFVRWQSDGSSRTPVLCDGANGSSTYTGSACQFATWENLQLQAVFVDDTAPTMASLSGPNQAVNGPTAFTFAAAADPTIQGFECRVANVHDWTACSSGRLENPASSGLYTFEVRAVDSSGNRSSVVSWPWTVDKIAPETSLLSGPTGTVATKNVEFAFNSNESGSFVCTLNAVASDCGSPKTYSNLNEGTYTFSVAARDAAGNLDPTPQTRNFTVDTVAPETGLTGGPTEGTKVASTSASFGLTSTEGTSFACTLDGAPQPCSATTNLTSLSQGAHTFTAAAVDSVGNTDLTPETRTWTVDTIRPVVSSFGPSGTRVSRTANISVTFSEAMRGTSIPAAFQLTLNGTKVPATVAYKRTATGKYVATLDPKRDLRPGKTYKVALRSTALDVAGNGVVAKSWSFRTRG
jgi:large repetitive protein